MLSGREGEKKERNGTTLPAKPGRRESKRAIVIPGSLASFPHFPFKYFFNRFEQMVALVAERKAGMAGYQLAG